MTIALAFNIFVGVLVYLVTGIALDPIFEYCAWKMSGGPRGYIPLSRQDPEYIAITVLGWPFLLVGLALNLAWVAVVGAAEWIVGRMLDLILWIDRRV